MQRPSVYLSLATLSLLLQPAALDAQVIGLGSRFIKLEPFHTFQVDSTAERAPTDMIQMPDGRFLVATLGGSVRMLDSSGSFVSTLLGPVETQTTKVDDTHYGMTSLALHPQFAVPNSFGYGKMYALVTQQPEGVTGVSADFTVPGSDPSMPFTNQDVVREYDISGVIDNGVTSYVGQPITSRDIWRIDSPQASHNAFDIAFRSNGDMYISSGDGGFTELGGSPLGSLHNRWQKSQDLDSAYGKILRINPDPNAYSLTGGQNDQYSIPDDNPFISEPGALAEVYANGVRSPYRMNLDPNDPNEETLWLGDVGAGSREEVSKITKGSNLGWGRFEGTLNRVTSVTMQGNAHTPPEFQYSHSPKSLNISGGKITAYNLESGGSSITGGHIYRGTLLGEDFQGLYIGANLGHHAENPAWLSRLFYGDPASELLELSTFQYSEFTQQFDDFFLDESEFVNGFDFEAARLTPGKFETPQLILSITEDAAGELYVLGVDFAGLGTISKIVAGPGPGDVDEVDGVTLADYEIIRSNLGKTVYSRLQGDLNRDNRVDLDDYQQWLEHAPLEVLALLRDSNRIPEPNSMILAGVFVVLGGILARRR